MKFLYAWIAGCAILFLSGCQSSLMTRASSPALAAASNEGATVVFLRPSSLGGAIQASVFDVTDGKTSFGGIVSTDTQVRMQLPAGEHLLMVQAENADFMNATLAPGKTYYVLVSPRIGVWKARFSLLPIHNDAAAKYSLKSEHFADWQKQCQLVEKSAAADAWYQAHQGAIESKRVDYMKKWDVMDAAHKAELTLHAEDGI